MSISVDQIYSTTSSTSSATGTDETLGKDAFLQMLVAQLQYQDPLNPMDGTEFTAQLAQFSSLEYLQNINDTLGEFMTAQNAANGYDAVNYIGKTVNALGNFLMIADGKAEPVQFSLADDCASVYVNIYDSDDNLVKTVDLGAMGAGVGEYEWDGTDNNGNPLADGNYTYDISAVDINEDSVDTYSFITATVTGVAFEDGKAYLISGDRAIALSDVIRVLEET